jgi:hypothetical protein
MHKHTLAFIILISIIIVGIICIPRESFENYVANDINIKFCPFNSDAHIFKGQTICCDGRFSDKIGCLEKTVCSLSSNSDGIPICGKIYRDYLKKNAIKFCPKSMSSYYEKNGKMNCYSGSSKEDGIEPLEMSQSHCPVYKNEKDYSDPKSCYNLKQLDKLPCLTSELCEKHIIPIDNNIPSLITQSFMGTTKMPGGKLMKMPRSCYYDDPARKYLNKVMPGWETHFKFEDSGVICSTADKVYVKMSKPVSSLRY